ncbi:MAG TPA: hypothetical protein PLI71_09895 [Clostridia bacterium]|nr:hypothetical protein [Clostridia bacterium]
MPSLYTDDGGRVTPQAYATGLTSFEKVTATGNAMNVNLASATAGVNVEVQGTVAHDSADSGKPVKMGVKAVDPSSMPADVSALDRADAIGDLKGRLMTTMDEVFGTPAAAVVAKGVQIALSDGTNARLMKGDSSGNLFATGEIAHDSADSGNPLKIGGKGATSRPSAVSNGDRVNAYFNEYGELGVNQGGKQINLHTSGAETSSGNGTAVTGLDGYGYAVITFDLTVAAAVAGDTFNLYIDTSHDGGTTWTNVVHFTECVGDGGAKRFVATVNSKGANGTAIIDGTSDLTTAPDIRHVLGNALRARWVIVDGGAHSQSFTFSVTANMKN